MVELARVWVVPLDVPPDSAAACWEVLDETERARAAAYLSPRDRQRFVIGHGAIRILAARELGTQPTALRWTTGRYGKPELAPPWSGLHTSLSHSADMIAAATSASRPVGVDIQHLERGLDTVRLAARFFGPDEAGYVAAGLGAGARADRFAHLWARKEAVVKAAGGRLWPNLAIFVRDRDVVGCAEPTGSHRVTDVTAPVGYRAAVALAGAAPYVLVTAGWPGEVTGSSRPSRSRRATEPGSAAAPGQARGRTAAPHRPGG
jgi:4'-phosphopantetheinyl transferase